MEVTAQNIANAGTAGYSRERAEIVTNPPWPVPSACMPSGPGQFGTGVNLQTVTRIRDQFLDTQYRQQNLLKGEWQQRSNTLSQVETIFGEPSSTGLSSDLDKFWQAWDNLSKTPENLPVRTTVVEAASTLADDLQNTYSQLTTLQGNLNTDISQDVSHINDDLRQIASLNATIKSATLSGLSPNDLLDQRDNLLDDLSTYINVKTVINADNTATLSIEGATVVDGPAMVKLTATPDASGNYQVGVDLGNGQSELLQWPDLGGQLYGLQQARDVDVQGYLDGLNRLTATVAGAVNSLHVSGYGLDGTTGIPFFVNGSNPANPEDSNNITASNIAVNPEIVNDPQKIAAAATPASGGAVPPPGDGSNALAISKLGSESLSFATATGAGTIIDTASNFYGSMIADLGIASSQASNMVNNQSALVTQLDNSRQSTSGVSLDEEMTNLVQQQSAYEAAAKLVNVIADMMQVVINMGATGQLGG
jgi:flagellar hook-associated protein 1 FlgK